MKLFILIFPITNLIISCADILYVEENDIIDLLPNSPETMVGFWFACEFGSSDINCRFLDDDGLQFTNDGSVFSIETSMIDPDPGCGPSPCFDSFRPSIFIDRQLVGSYIYIDSSLTFNPESDTSCTEYLNWNSDFSFFRDSLSLCPFWGLSSLYFKKYTGDVVIN